MDRRAVPFEEQIGSTGVTVVRKPNASSVDEKAGDARDMANQRAMSMPKDNHRPLEQAVDSFELSIGCVISGGSPAALRSRMDKCEGVLRAYQRQFAQPRQSLLS